MASLDSVNLDQVVDYRAEYTAVIQKYKITGDNLVGLCPPPGQERQLQR